MNCQNHPEVPATAYCRACGKPLCEVCRRDAHGTVFCQEHAPDPAPAPPVHPAATPYPPAPGTMIYSDCSPGWALALGLTIPGVGAIYNGQYAKGLVHAVIFGLLVSILSSGSASGLEPLFGLIIAVWVFYMGFEAYHTALKRRRGEPVDEFSSLINLRGHSGRFPVAGVALILLGILLLLNTLDLPDFRHVARYWPLLLIALGAYLLYARASATESPDAEVRHERQ